MSEESTPFDPISSFVHASGIALAGYLVGSFLLLLAGGALAGLGVSLADRPTLRIGLGTVLLQGVAFGGTALAYLVLSDRDWSFVAARMPDLRDVGAVIVGIVGLFGALFAFDIVFGFLGVSTAESQLLETGRSEPIIFLLLVPASYLLVGPGEELLYRGVVQGTLEETFSTIRAIVLASALFTIIHVSSLQGEGAIATLTIVFMLSMVLGALYVWTENLTVPALVHATYNAVTFATQYLEAV